MGIAAAGRRTLLINIFGREAKPAAQTRASGAVKRKIRPQISCFDRDQDKEREPPRLGLCSRGKR
jgi:hypothetical protein